ncbi:hypothetical protein ACS0TY_015762 [Phlomoides rotata]
MAPTRRSRRGHGRPRAERISLPAIEEVLMEQEPSPQTESELPQQATPTSEIVREVLISLQNFFQQQVPQPQPQPQQQPPPPPSMFVPMPHLVARANDFVEQFRRLQPPRLNGKEGPLGTEEWIAGLERIFRHMTLTDVQKISCAQFQLMEDAAQWWESYERTLNAEDRHALTWVNFKEAVLARYFPQVLRGQKEQEFITLKQGTSSVTEYERRFNRLSRYAPHLVGDDSRKAKRFEQGLRPEIAGIVVGLNIASYHEIFDRALKISISMNLEYKQAPATIPVNRNWQPNFKRNHVPPPKRNNYNAPRIVPFCNTCKKKHFGQCRQGTVTCYCCHQPGHRSNECNMPLNANRQTVGNNQYHPQPVNKYQARQLTAPTNRQIRPPGRGPPNQGQRGPGHINALLGDGESSGEQLLLENQEQPGQHETLAGFGFEEAGQ